MRASLCRRGRNCCATRHHSASLIKYRALHTCLFAGVALFALAPALAQETITYTYDARGRLVQADHGTTGPDAGIVSNYTYDKANNRTNVTATGSSRSGSAATRTTTAIVHLVQQAAP